MKKFLKFLVPLISLLFIINVKADTIIQYESIIVNDIEKYQLIEQLINDNYNTYFTDIDRDNDIVFINGNTTTNEFYLYVIQNNSTISNSNGYFSWSGYTYHIYTNNDYTELTSVDNWGYWSPNTSYVNTMFGGSYSFVSFGQNSTLQLINNSSNVWTFSNYENTNSQITLSANNQLNLIDIINALNNYSPITEPTYEYEETILESGNVKLDFTFTNYIENSGYAFEIENGLSNEEYGITNTYSNIFPKQIPFGTSYSIELPFDTFLYITLAKYEQVEDTSLYYREEIYTNMIDINNVVFENSQDPYFVIYRQNKNLIEGSFANTTSQNTCWYRYSTSQNEDFVPCNETLGLSFHDNGYVEVIIKKGNQTVYSRKINYLGGNNNEPYIVYQINKQDFYSVVNWSVENASYDSNLTYRYSTDNGSNYSTWSLYSQNNNNNINAFGNSTIIIEIANNNQGTIYDSKSIVVVNDISNIKNINNTTTNFIDKFKSIFSVNGNILKNVNNFYDNIKLSKVYLLIFIPFLTSLIAGIIYLIRRK